jgi:hypothetical protein
LKDRTTWEVFEAERAALIDYPGRFDGFHATPASVSKSCLVRFDRNRYSVAAKAVSQPVQVQAYAERVVIRLDGEIVGEHARRFGRDKTAYNPWHYVPALGAKPGALRNGAPFKSLPLRRRGTGSCRRPWLRCAGAWPAMMTATGSSSPCLPAVLEDGLAAVEAACTEALAAGLASRDVILNILSRGRDEPQPPTIATPARLTLVQEPVADCTRYDRLRAPALGDAGGAA